MLARNDANPFVRRLDVYFQPDCVDVIDEFDRCGGDWGAHSVAGGMDGDGDGQITKNEFREARKDRLRMMREQRRQRGHGNGDRKGMHKGHSESN